MSNLEKALSDKIKSLEEEKLEIKSYLESLEAKIFALREILEDEKSPPDSLFKRKQVLETKSTKNTEKVSIPKQSTVPKDELWEQARNTLPGGAKPSTEEDRQRAKKRFNPSPRPPSKYNVKIGSKIEDVTMVEGKQSHINISSDEDN